jgi:hypothetical protein
MSHLSAFKTPSSGASSGHVCTSPRVTEPISFFDVNHDTVALPFLRMVGKALARSGRDHDVLIPDGLAKPVRRVTTAIARASEVSRAQALQAL